MTYLIFILLLIIAYRLGYERCEDKRYRDMRKRHREMESKLPRVNLKKQVV